MLLMALILAVSVNGFQQRQNSRQNDKVCMSEDCQFFSKRISDMMNRNVDPCDDFYQFACGRYIENTEIPADKGYWTSGTSPLKEEVAKRGKELLEARPKESKFMSDELIRNMYNSCMDKAKMEELGVEPFKDDLKEFGGMPVLEGLYIKGGHKIECDGTEGDLNPACKRPIVQMAFPGERWDPGSDKWYDAIPKMAKLGYDVHYIMALYIQPDPDDSTSRVVEFDQPILGLSKEFLKKGFNTKEVQYYYKYMVNASILLGAEETRARDEMKEALFFEMALANIFTPAEKRGSKNRIMTTYRDFNLPGFPTSMKKYVNEIFANLGCQDIQMADNEKLMFWDSLFTHQLSKLLNKTSSRVIANYHGWRAFMDVASKLNNDARSLKDEYNMELMGFEEPAATWKDCVKSSGFQGHYLNFLLAAASSMYVRSFFTPETKKIAEGIDQDIADASETIINKLDWMDKETKKAALEKLKRMGKSIGYPDELLNPDKLNELYKGLVINPNSYFKNMMTLSKSSKKFYVKTMRVKTSRTAWTNYQDATQVNAGYTFEKNVYVVAAGILQGLLFNPKAPKYLNYGAIGATAIGHEITHGFDIRGKDYDSEANLKNWWHGNTNNTYDEKTKCFIYQYGNYTAKQINMTVNGINTLGENIADNGGAKQAYLAYSNYVTENGEEQRLVNLSYTPKQLFWISFGQARCDKIRNKSLRHDILNGLHAPNEFRTIGVVSNNKNFSQDFNCKIGSPMNPEKKCSIW